MSEGELSPRASWTSRRPSAVPNGGGNLTGSLDVSVSKFLREHVLFKDVKDEKFIEKLASSLQIRVYADRDMVIRKGEVGRAMFFILRGQIEVVSEDGKFFIFKDFNSEALIIKYKSIQVKRRARF
jgi:signal-transduction protein with cAMP-binding, CBS, and nucleotidyltransferase domain